MLEVRGLYVSYGPIAVLGGLDMTVGDGEIVAFIGPNGAGKTTTLAGIAGSGAAYRRDHPGRQPLPPRAEEVVRHGVALVPQGRRIFPTMTVEENLFMGAYAVGGTWKDAAARFAPVLRDVPAAGRAAQSDGQQPVRRRAADVGDRPGVAVQPEAHPHRRAVPRTGAPRMVETLLEAIVELNRDRGTACVLVEQAASAALSISNTAYLLRKGEVVYSGPAARLREDKNLLREAYLGKRTTRPDSLLAR